MADATVTTQPAPDTIVAVDVATIQIDLPLAAVGTGTVVPAQPLGRVHYRLRIVWQSGKVEYREGNVTGSDFAANVSAFCQSAPKKKFLQSLVALGYEPNIVPQ